MVWRTKLYTPGQKLPCIEKGYLVIVDTGHQWIEGEIGFHSDLYTSYRLSFKKNENYRDKMIKHLVCHKTISYMINGEFGEKYKQDEAVLKFWIHEYHASNQIATIPGWAKAPRFKEFNGFHRCAQTIKELEMLLEENKKDDYLAHIIECKFCTYYHIERMVDCMKIAKQCAAFKESISLLEQGILCAENIVQQGESISKKSDRVILEEISQKMIEASEKISTTWNYDRESVWFIYHFNEYTENFYVYDETVEYINDEENAQNNPPF